MGFFEKELRDGCRKNQSIKGEKVVKRGGKMVNKGVKK